MLCLLWIYCGLLYRNEWSSISRILRNRNEHHWCTIMLGDISRAEHIYLAVGYTDMRKQIDGFSAFITAQFRLASFSNSVFLLCGRNTRVMKSLYWEGYGFVLLYKRLEDSRFKWPRDKSEAREITPLIWLMMLQHFVNNYLLLFGNINSKNLFNIPLNSFPSISSNIDSLVDFASLYIM